MNLPIEIRTRGRGISGLVYDLAPEGCLVGCSNGLITAGDRLALRFACGPKLGGRAVEVHGSVVRVEFELALHEAVLAHLLQSAGPGAPATSRPRTHAGGHGHPIV